MVLYLTLLVCAFLAGLLVYRYDMYEREPLAMLVLAAALGFGLMALMTPLETWTLGWFDDAPLRIATIAAVASTHEELGRLLVVVAIAVLVPAQFNDPMDGIIYGSMVGLGMAVEESISVVGDLLVTPGTLPPGEIVRLFAHLVMGGITAFGVGLARMRRPGWPRMLVGCVLASMFLHFTWDWIALTAQREQHMTWMQTAAAVALMLAGIILYGALVVVGSDWSRGIFAPHRPRSLWGWPFALLVRPGRGPGPPTAP